MSIDLLQMEVHRLDSNQKGRAVHLGEVEKGALTQTTFHGPETSSLYSLILRGSYFSENTLVRKGQETHLTSS